MRRDLSFWLAVLLAATSFALISIDRNNSSKLDHFRGKLRDSVSFFTGGASAGIRKLTVEYESSPKADGSSGGNGAAGKRVRELEEKIIYLTEEKKECERRVGLAILKNEVNRETGLKTTVARVIGEELTNWQSSLLVDRGTGDGVGRGDAVIAGDAGEELPGGRVVGTIYSAGEKTSVVLLLTDRRSSIGGIVQRNRVHGIVKGGTSGRCAIDDISNTADVAAGDVILTSGIGETFPGGFLVGRVVSAQKKGDGFFQEIVVEPAVDISRLENVIILGDEL